MDGRGTVRGSRRLVIVDLLLSVVVASLILAGFRALIDTNLYGSVRTAATAALLGMPVLAMLYGASAAIEMRQGWTGSSIVSGLLHGLLVLGSVAGIGVLAIACPLAACMALGSVSMLLLWSATWV